MTDEEHDHQAESRRLVLGPTRRNSAHLTGRVLRPSVPRWTVVACCMAGALFAGCGYKPSAAVVRAKVLLPSGRPQEAIDQLGSEDTPPAHYLRYVALTQLELSETAAAELDKAVQQDPNNVNYRALQLAIKLQATKVDSDAAAIVDEILKLYQENQSSATVALAAMIAHARKREVAASMSAFRASVALSDQIPELLPLLLNRALTAQLPVESQTLMDKLDKISPDDPLLAQQRIAVMMVINKIDEAVRLAKEFYQKENGSEGSAVLYAKAMSAMAAAPDRDRTMEEIVRRYPRNLNILNMYSTYLAKSGRLPQAVEFLDQTVSQMPPDSKNMTMHLAVALPFAFKDAKLAEAVLNRYRSFITEPLYLQYHEARLKHIQKDYAGAMAGYKQVVEAAAKDGGIKGRTFAYEALTQMRQVQIDQAAPGALRQAADALAVSPGAVKPVDAKKTDPGTKPKTGESKSKTAEVKSQAGSTKPATSGTTNKSESEKNAAAK